MPEIIFPTEKTLEKYGLTAEDYQAMYEAQNGLCPICGKPPKKTFYVDHQHVKGWKNLPPEKRKLYVRGLLCYFCNRFYLAKAITPEKAQNIIKYLSDYELRQK